ncbi:cytochrome c [Mesorhizobium sp. B2-4-17]|uniref:c-type cytochrome n=1 Tax=Mesorhizobium sp. B2-4-17 TaxID=2589932 RepID=UPI001FEDAB02|nr:cytochrome c [Mesorhizobium sp. B2-4-17]
MVLGGVAVAGIAGLVVSVHEPALARIARPARENFEADSVRRGEQLATLGDCIVCHTADDGAPFAGSRPLRTPFGTLYSTNITPDELTGIGNWSEEAFVRAMKNGVARDGNHLYPALPYEHFTHVTDGDLKAIYAFLMTRRSVSRETPANDLLPGLGFRPLLAGWKLLFLRRGEFEPVMDRTAEWNRGKYLVEGLAHCGACHTPRNLVGGEERGREFDGGVAEGWNAPALDASNPSADRWTETSLHAYLKTGFDKAHGAAGGPMGPVAEGLSRVDDADVKAIAVYVAARMQAGKDRNILAIDNAVEAETRFPQGAHLFQGACAGCHETGSPMGQQGRPPLSQLTAVKMADPTNAALALLQGLPATNGRDQLMPPFAETMSDKDLADVLAYVRARFSDGPAWENLKSLITTARLED